MPKGWGYFLSLYSYYNSYYYKKFKNIAAKYIKKRVVDKKSPEDLQISYIWEDKDSIQMSKEEATTFMIKGFQQQINQLQSFVANI